MTDDDNSTLFASGFTATAIVGSSLALGVPAPGNASVLDHIATPSMTTPHSLPFEAEQSSISSQFQVAFGVFPATHDTSLGARLMAIRQRAISQGMPLMTQDEILAEVRRRRGELPDEDDPNLS